MTSLTLAACPSKDTPTLDLGEQTEALPEPHPDEETLAFPNPNLDEKTESQQRQPQSFIVSSTKPDNRLQSVSEEETKSGSMTGRTQSSDTNVSLSMFDDL